MLLSRRCRLETDHPAAFDHIALVPITLLGSDSAAFRFDNTDTVLIKVLRSERAAPVRYPENYIKVGLQQHLLMLHDDIMCR